jgi:hypothetical protein
MANTDQDGTTPDASAFDADAVAARHGLSKQDKIFQSVSLFVGFANYQKRLRRFTGSIAVDM